MVPALWWLNDQQADFELWHLENNHEGNVHFDAEEKGVASRFITLNAMIIQKTYQNEAY